MIHECDIEVSISSSFAFMAALISDFLSFSTKKKTSPSVHEKIRKLDPILFSRRPKNNVKLAKASNMCFLALLENRVRILDKI